MKKLGVVCLSALLGVGASNAQTSAYFQAITNLNPAGYWPMHEVEAAAPGDTEHNYGTLGLLGTGYYPDWASANGNIIRRQFPGALANDPDTAVYFAKAIMSGSGVSFTNALVVPHNSPLTTLNAPFSVECWYYPTNTGAQDVWGQNGFEGLNAGNAGAGVGAISGLRFTFGGGGQNFAAFGFNNSTTLNSLVSSTAETVSNWYHVVLTCDANTNFTLYVNGSAVSSAVGVGKYSPDYWTPLTIGSGRGGTRAISGGLDEFAVYTNVINDVSTHYNDGISGAAGAYLNDVTNDNPVIYLRMDAPTYAVPPISGWPVLQNFGITNSVAVGNGVYTPGTMAGILMNLANPNGVPFGGVSNTLAGLSGVSSFADAGSAPAYNPTGSNASFTVTAMFRGNPCDNRIQSIVGHGTNSWQLSMTTNGCLVFNAGNGNKAAGGTGQSAGDISTRRVYNDGNWHQVVAVNSTNVISIFVDGILDTNGTPGGIAVTNIIRGNANDVMIGSDPTYTNNPAGVGRSFAGQICEVAFFTNALTASQVQTLYSALGVAPYITTQPATSSTVNGGAGSSISFNVVANGSSLAYQWYFNTTSNYSGAIKLADNVVHYTNSTTADVTVTNLTGADSGYYFVVITNGFGVTTSLLASLTVNTAPTIASSLPVTYTNLFTLYAGASPRFSVTAEGSQPLYYQWFTNGVLDTAATSSNMVWANVPIGTITNTCLVTNAAGFATNVWIASVVADPTAPYPQQVLALNPIGYWRLNEPDDGTQSADGNAGVVAHDYVAGNDGVYTNTGLGGYYGFLGTPPPYSQTETNTTPAGFGLTLADSDAYSIDGIDFSAPANTSVAFSVEAWVNGFQQSADAGIVSKGYGGAEQFDLDTGSDGGSPSHAFRFFVRDAAGNTHLVNSSIQPGSVWHHLVGVCDEPNSNVTLYVDGVMVGTASISPNAGILSSSRPMIIGSRPSSSTTNNNDQFVGFVQDVAVYNHALSASQVADQYTSVGVQPTLSPTPPTSMTVSAGGTLVIPAGTVGTPVLGYTWYDENGGTNVATGTTNGDSLDATLTVGNVPEAWNGDTFQLTVTNAYGTTSATVSLTVITTPQITVDLPSSVTVGSGQSYTYSIGISASTPQPVFYQWYNAGTQITGATNANYVATAGSPGSSTTYDVVISNSFGAVTSSTSTLTSISIPPVSGAYATNVLGLNPAGYWPMHEVETPAPGDTEHNYGTLGLLGTAYYPDWLSDGSINAFTRQVAGALVNDPDPSLHYNILNQPSVGVWTNVIYVPHTSPLATLNPPFSVECWFYPTNSGGGSSAQSVWGQHGFEALNAGYAGSGNGPYKGVQLNYNGSFQVFVYANGVQVGTAGSASAAINQWHHIVSTCDANTNITLYLDGTASTTVAAAGEYLPDYWTPLTIGGTRGGTRSCAGSIDEFAVYTNVITDVSTHYNDALTGASGQYFSDVTNDNPVIYLRMDAPDYTPPPENTWPELFNYGSDAIIGVYTPGTVPGIISGPAFVGLSGTNVAHLSGVSSFADAGFAGAFNPTGSNANFTVAAMFHGNPCDNRVQTIVGHGTNSWQLSVTTNGCLVFNAGNGNTATEGTGQNAGDIRTRGVYNDGNWHQVVAVAQANAISIYVDGALDTNGMPSGITATSVIPGSASDVLIGSDPSYTNTPAGVGRQFAGQVCDVAFFTNALTTTQIQQIYNAALGQVVNTNPTNLLFSNSGDQLTLSWPADHIGWQLQSNSAGLTATNSWFIVPGSTATDQMTFTPDRTRTNVFYRMLFQQ